MRLATCAMIFAALMPTAATAKDPVPEKTMAVVRYYMPRTVVTATATLRLKDCKKPDASVELVLSAKADAATGKAYTFDPTALASWRQSRDFSVTLNPNGTLAGFNSASEDKTGAIIGNILKTVVSFAGLLSTAGTASDFCNAATADAMRRATVIRAQLVKLRPLEWKDTDPLPGEKDAALAESLATELAAIESGQLTLVLSKDVDLGATLPTADVVIDWPTAPLGKWFKPITKVASLEAIRLTVTGAKPDEVKRASKCERYVSIPQPAIVSIAAKNGSGDSVTALTTPVQQWGHVGIICLDAPVFASRTVNATFDAFGQMTKLDWKSNARGDAASAALLAAVDQAATFKTAVKPVGETAALKDQGDLLDQQIRVEKLRRCLELMQTGGTCPS